MSGKDRSCPARRKPPTAPGPTPADLKAERADLIARAQALAARRGLISVSQTQFRRAKLPVDRAKRLFGSWNDFNRAAGLQPNESRKRIDDALLLRAVRDACIAAGGIVSVTHFNRKGRYGQGPFRQRWGGWRNVLLALREWAEREDPQFQFLHLLPQTGERLPRSLTSWPPPERRYGAPLNYPGFLHQPVNEQGVVLLFGALARPLGFAIEHVSGQFPDCEAKRRVGLDVWERCRIEFEYQSRNFQTHGHDPQGCDLIVCWEDNWPDSPVPVMQLRAEVGRLRAKEDTQPY